MVLKTSVQSMLKYSRPPHVQEPDILDIKKILRKSTQDVKLFNDVRHFRFKANAQDPTVIEMSWKKASVNEEWEGNLMYFPRTKEGQIAEVNVSDLVEVTKTSGGILVWFCV